MNRHGKRKNKFTRPMPEPTPIPQRKEYIGVCVGGPHDKSFLSHWEKEKAFFASFTPGLFVADNAPIIPIEIGRYIYHEIQGYPGVFTWHETQAGTALKTLNKIVE